MKTQRLHRWDLTPAQARDLQLALRDRVELADRIPKLTCVAGADVALELPGPRSWQTGTGRAIAGIVVYRFPQSSQIKRGQIEQGQTEEGKGGQLEEIERVSAVLPLTFPYVPGLLSFREIPALLAACKRLKNVPDLIFCDGQGRAHPRRFGLACHLGLLLDLPTIGVAKSILIGECHTPGRSAGNTAPLVDPKTGEVIGAAVRTATGVKPVYVSSGHRVSLATAVSLALAVADGFRVPRPTREADRFVGAIRRARKAAADARKER